MSYATFLSSLDTSSSCLKSSPVLRALWLDYQDKWEEAHEAIQNEEDLMSAAVHAYLHRKEGDPWNANYWYRTADRKPFRGSLEDEWETLVAEECKRLGLSQSEVPFTAAQSSSQRG